MIENVNASLNLIENLLEEAKDERPESLFVWTDEVTRHESQEVTRELVTA